MERRKGDLKKKKEIITQWYQLKKKKKKKKKKKHFLHNMKMTDHNCLFLRGWLYNDYALRKFADILFFLQIT